MHKYASELIFFPDRCWITLNQAQKAVGHTSERKGTRNVNSWRGSGLFNIIHFPFPRVRGATHE